MASSLVLSFEDGRIDIAWRGDSVDDPLRDVSLVIVSRDGASASMGFLRRLAESLPAGFAGEVVVDRACVPDTRPPVTIVDTSTAERFEDRLELCAKVASRELLVVLDGKTWPVPGFVRPLVAALRSGAAGLVTGALVHPDGRLVADPEARLDAVRHSFVRHVEEVPTCFFASRRELAVRGDDADGARLYEPAAVAIAAWEEALVA